MHNLILIFSQMEAFILWWGGGEVGGGGRESGTDADAPMPYQAFKIPTIEMCIK